MAPLFGATIDLKPILLFAKKHNILVIEDCAQSFHGWDNLKPSDADVGLYSFGPIKTSTALGGAVVVTHDKSLASRLRFIHQNYPTQRRSAYARRVIKYFVLKLASTRRAYSLLFLLSKKMKVDADSAISRLAKNFGDGDLISKIRLRPSAALFAVLARRQRRYPRSRCDIRMEIGRRLRKQICTNERNDHILIPGSQAAGHSYWVFPMKWRSTDGIRNRLRMNGFDATSKHNLVLVRSIREIEDNDTPNMQDLLDHILFLPVHPELPLCEADRLAELVVDCLDDSSTSRKNTSGATWVDVDHSPTPNQRILRGQYPSRTKRVWISATRRSRSTPTCSTKYLESRQPSRFS